MVFSTLGRYLQYRWGITSVQWRDNISTVEGIQYSGERFLISPCLAIENDEKISIFFCITKRNFHSEVSKILADFMSFNNWIGVLQVQPCVEIIDYFIFRMLYVSFKFNSFCNCM